MKPIKKNKFLSLTALLLTCVLVFSNIPAFAAPNKIIAVYTVTKVDVSFTGETLYESQLSESQRTNIGQNQYMTYEEIQEEIEIAHKAAWEQAEAANKAAWDADETTKHIADPEYIPQEYIGEEYSSLIFTNNPVLDANLDKIEGITGVNLNKTATYKYIDGNIVKETEVEVSLIAAEKVVRNKVNLSVSTLEHETDMGYTLQSNLSGAFSTNQDVLLYGDYDGIMIDYYWPMQEPTLVSQLDEGYSALVEYNVNLSTLNDISGPISGSLSIPLPNGLDGTSAKIIGGPSASASSASTITFPVTLDAAYGSAFVNFLVEYKELPQGCNGNHTGGTATCKEKAICENCGEEYGELDAHTYKSTWSTNEKKHWYECSVCKAVKSEAAHIYDNDADATCNICNYERTITPAAPKMTKGENGTWTIGSESGLSFTSDAAFSEFVSVSVDGKVIAESNYDKKEGSTIITLKPAYLKTLSAGKHTITITSTYGSASSAFIIEKGTTPSATNTTTTAAPKTGDSSPLAIYYTLMLLSGFTFVGVTIFKKRKNDES